MVLRFKGFASTKLMDESMQQSEIHIKFIYNSGRITSLAKLKVSESSGPSDYPKEVNSC